MSTVVLEGLDATDNSGNGPSVWQIVSAGTGTPVLVSVFPYCVREVYKMFWLQKGIKPSNILSCGLKSIYFLQIKLNYFLLPIFKSYLVE